MNVDLERRKTLAALQVYGTWNFAKTQEALTVVTIDRVQYSIGFSQACHKAAELLENETFYQAKFNILIEGMKKVGLDRAYQFIMGENIDEAIK